MKESSLEFFSEEIDFDLSDPLTTKEWIQKSILNEHLSPGDLNFIFCSDEYLLKINQDYLNHDYYTDIITFDYRDGNVISGDLFISIDRVRENAKNSSLDFLSEIHRVIIHGVLHIMGYNDKTPEEESIIRSKEDFYLSLDRSKKQQGCF